jgi:peptidoglycan/LPS O-acetylase OafA/YrhL
MVVFAACGRLWGAALSRPALAVVSVVALAPVTWLGCRWIERPCVDLGHRLTTRWRACR